MSEDILNPDYWRERLAKAPPGERHHAVFRCPLDRWQRIEAKHREILAAMMDPSDWVLDAGCGWGRLLNLMPAEWLAAGGGGHRYVGIDVSPDFIAEARRSWPDLEQRFVVGDLRSLPEDWKDPIGGECRFDWAVLISMRPMIRRNLGGEVWDQIEAELRRVAKRLLFLEYDEDDEGSVE